MASPVARHALAVEFAPRVDHRLVEVVQHADVERSSIADVWRLVGAEAEHLGVSRPGYHSILRLVLAERERRAARREAIAEAVGELWAFTGTDVEKLVGRLRTTQRRSP
jgi:hypothetical protein